MASIQIHIVIGKEYLKKNKIRDIKAFMSGIIEPDLGDTCKTHYSGVRNENNLKDYLANKVNLKKFLLENTLDGDYQKGYFLHLVTDYLFYNNFFSNDYLDSVSYKEFAQDLYYSYPINNQFLEEEYGLEYFGYQKEIEDSIKKARLEKKMSNEERKYILDSDRIRNFIEEVASIDLEEYQEFILEKC